MLWTLWIVSIVLDPYVEEPKWTRYETFETEEECWMAWHDITTEIMLTEDPVNHFAFCGPTT